MPSYRKRGEKWYYSFEIAKIDGQRKRIERVGGRTKKEAIEKAAMAMNEYMKAGQLFDESNMSFADYLDYWYKQYVEVNLKYNTRDYYGRIIKDHLKPILGHYRIDSLNPSILQEYINGKMMHGYSKSSVSNFMGVLSKSLSMAVYPYQFIKSNPMQYVSMPKYDTVNKKDKLKIISVNDMKRILEKFPWESNFHIPIQIAVNTGMRIGEVCALTWDCVDLENGLITVNKTLIIKPMGVYELGTPKTEGSYRDIDISKPLIKILRKQKLRQKENQLRYGVHYNESDFVCTKENGKLVTQNSLKYLSRIVNHEMLIPFTFHSFRHTHASMLLASGANIKAIQERLGHDTIITTLNTYSHIMKDLRESTKTHLEDLSAQIY